MKKRFLSCFMALALCLTLLPATALAEGTEGTAQTPPAVEKAADPANGEEQQENQPAAPKQENQSADQEEQQEDSAAKQAVATVQALIDALPAVDELDGMDDEDAMAAYDAVQAAYDAYEALTEAQKAEITGADRFEALFGWFNEQVATLAGTETQIEVATDGVDADGTINSNGFRANCFALTDELATGTLSRQYYMVQSDMTINGNLTVDGTDSGGLVLCDGATLTVNGALIHQGGSSFFIYGQTLTESSKGTGKLVIKNSLDSNGAAIRATGNNAQLGISSGEVTINAGKSGKLVEGVKLYSTNKIHTATLDAKKVSPDAWSDNTSIEGTSLVLEYCDHNDADTVWIKDDDTQHHWQCKACGFTSTAKVEHAFRPVERNTETHTMKCDLCRYEAAPAQHHFKDLKTPEATSDGKGHTTKMCEDCSYTSGEAEAHKDWDEQGACGVCGFKPILEGKTGNLYDDLATALDEGETALTLVSYATGDANKGIAKTNLEFDRNATITLDMGGCTLENSTGGATITVASGTLTVKGEATIKQTGTAESASSAVRVTGGTLIFDGKLTATGANGKPAVEVTGGTLRLKAGDVLNGGVSVASGTVADLLGENLAFAKVGETSTIVKGDVKSISEDVTVVTHPHSFKLNSDGKYVCACGYVCPHDKFENGVCTVCHNGCAHTSVDENGVCENCKTQMAAKIEAGGKTTYSTDFEAAMDNAANGTKITLLANAAVGTVGLEGKAVTLDLNGKTVKNSGEGSQPIQIGSSNSPASLIITGSGSFTSWFQTLVVENGTLDLSRWTGDNSYICMVTISGASSQFISPTGTEKIRELAFIEGADTASLNGGRYDKIAYERGSGIQLGNLLAKGYSFRQNGTFLEYASRLENDDTVKNVEVVPCPHVDAEGGKCLYCGQTGILARVGDTTYDDVSKAVSAWLANGGTLKLYADAGDRSNVDFSSGANKPFVIDLNGFAFNKDGAAITLGGGKALTITDSSGKGTGVFGPVTADRGTLTLESGCLEKLTVPSSSTAKILLKGGRVNCISYFLPIYNLLMAGGVLMKDGVPVDPAAILDPDVTATYTVKDSNNQLTQPGDPVTISYGQDTLPFVFALVAHDKAVAQLQFTWYQVNENGTLTALASSENTKPASNSLYTYDTATTGTTALSGLTPGAYKAVCVVSGLDGDGSCLWMAPYANRKLIVEKADLKNAEISFVGGGQKMFWPDPANHSVGKIEISSVFDAYTVTLNGKKLAEGTDYRVISGNIATGIGTYDLTIEGIAPNYSGTKTAQWTVVPHPLGTFKISQTKKQYDGTVALPDGAFLGKFFPMDPYLPDITLREGTDYVVTDARVDTPDASKQAKPYRYTVELKNPNYVFANGTKVQTWVYGVDVDMPIEITKADAPAAREGALEVINNHADTYTVDLSALLPALEAPREYGAVTYGAPTVNLSSGYYTDGARVEDGKLILPIQAVETSTESNIGTVTVKVTSGNIVDFDLTINVNATNKIVPTGTPTLSKTTLAWGEQLSTIALSGTMTDPTDSTKTVKGKFEWVTPGAAKEKIGEYEVAWKFTPDENAVYTEAAGTVTITVTKATPTGAPDYTKITTTGKTLKDANLTVGTIQPEGAIQWELGDKTVVTANTAYKWVFIPNDDAHYNELTGSITPYSVSSSSGGGGGSDNNPVIKTETKNNADGSTTKTETKKDGSVTQTTTAKDGSVSKTETKKDGSSVTENKAADGSTGTVKTDKHGQTTAETTLSSKAVEDAKKNGEAVKAPVEVEASRNSNTAPTVKVELPKGTGETKVEIPVSNVKPGTVAVLVHPDGTEEILKDSIPTENGIQLTVDGSATVKIIDNSKGFIDTQDHWAKDAIDFVSARGLVNGMSATIYAPNNSTTRAQLWTILARQNDAELTGGATWYEKAQNWAKAKGISDGANPNAAINRAQMVTMLWRAEGQPAAGGAASFTDVSADSYYAQAVAWAVENGITTGVGNGRFDPAGACTRAQIAAFLYRYMK